MKKEHRVAAAHCYRAVFLGVITSRQSDSSLEKESSPLLTDHGRWTQQER